MGLALIAGIAFVGWRFGTLEKPAMARSPRPPRPPHPAEREPAPPPEGTSVLGLQEACRRLESGAPVEELTTLLVRLATEGAPGAEDILDSDSSASSTVLASMLLAGAGRGEEARLRAFGRCRGGAAWLVAWSFALRVERTPTLKPGFWRVILGHVLKRVLSIREAEVDALYYGEGYRLVDDFDESVDSPRAREVIIERLSGTDFDECSRLLLFTISQLAAIRADCFPLLRHLAASPAAPSQLRCTAAEQLCESRTAETALFLRDVIAAETVASKPDPALLDALVSSAFDASAETIAHGEGAIVLRRLVLSTVGGDADTQRLAQLVAYKLGAWQHLPGASALLEEMASGSLHEDLAVPALIEMGRWMGQSGGVFEARLAFMIRHAASVPMSARRQAVMGLRSLLRHRRPPDAIRSDLLHAFATYPTEVDGVEDLRRELAALSPARATRDR